MKVSEVLPEATDIQILRDRWDEASKEYFQCRRVAEQSGYTDERNENLQEFKEYKQEFSKLVKEQTEENILEAEDCISRVYGLISDFA